MNLSTKILLGAASAVLVTTLASIGTVHKLSSDNRVKALREQMSSVIQQSESVAGNMDYMHKHEAFDKTGLISKAKQQVGDRTLRDAYVETSFYVTIPVVAAWKTVEDSAKRYGYTFSTPSHPATPARNPRNNNGAEFAEAFKEFERGEKEYFRHDKARNELILARPVRLTTSCLSCHGDPQRSPSADGKDILGFAMEGMKLDDIKGAFVLKAPLANDLIMAATMKAMAAIGGLVLGIVLLGFYFFSRRAIIRPLTSAIGQISSASEQTASAADQISSSSQRLAEGASEQAASLEETSASLEEITSMVKRNAESARKAKEISSQTRAAADTGAQDMEVMQRSMADIKTSSDEIAKIVKNIDEIAFQTNILALNAAVEAARAGEAGSGFAVVADEVRNLAQRSAVAAKETAAKISDAIGNTAQGVQVSGKVAESLKAIIEKARAVDDLVGEIAAASTEQAQGVDQVSRAVTEMDKVTQSNAASAEESASAAEELNSQAESVSNSVGALIRLVGGGTVSETADRPTIADAAEAEKRKIKAPSRQSQGKPASPYRSAGSSRSLILHGTGLPGFEQTAARNNGHPGFQDF